MNLSKNLITKLQPFIKTKQKIDLLMKFQCLTYFATLKYSNRELNQLEIKLNNKIQNKIENNFLIRKFCTTGELDSITFEKVCEDTLNSLNEYFEEIIDNNNTFIAADISYSNGVLTVNFGDDHGTYVINRQSPNKQIWLSSPKSGPKRYDFINGHWIYKHDGKTLHQLLQDEISQIISNIDFLKYAN